VVTTVITSGLTTVATFVDMNGLMMTNKKQLIVNPQDEPAIRQALLSFPEKWSPEVVSNKFIPTGTAYLINPADVITLPVSLKEFLPHTPKRGSDVERYIKSERDSYDESLEPMCWEALDNLLDDYQIRADLGLELNDPLSEGE